MHTPHSYPVWRLAEGGMERCEVPGGWIYREPGCGALAFVPCPPQAVGAQAPPAAASAPPLLVHRRVTRA